MLKIWWALYILTFTFNIYWRNDGIINIQQHINHFIIIDLFIHQLNCTHTHSRTNTHIQCAGEKKLIFGCHIHAYMRAGARLKLYSTFHFSMSVYVCSFAIITKVVFLKNYRLIQYQLLFLMKPISIINNDSLF